MRSVDILFCFFTPPQLDNEGLPVFRSVPVQIFSVFYRSFMAGYLSIFIGKTDVIMVIRTIRTILL